jgi:hypothetical protein
MPINFDRLRMQATPSSEANAFREPTQMFPDKVLDILCLPKEYLTMHENDTGTCEEFSISVKDQIFQGKTSNFDYSSSG